LIDAPHSRSSWLRRVTLALVILLTSSFSMLAFGQIDVHGWDGDGVDDPYQEIAKSSELARRSAGGGYVPLPATM
jgi:hypothetical protein